jgi:hypothetical protein
MYVCVLTLTHTSTPYPTTLCALGMYNSTLYYTPLSSPLLSSPLLSSPHLTSPSPYPPLHLSTLSSTPLYTSLHSPLNLSSLCPLYHRLLFLLACFHSVMQERRTYIPQVRVDAYVVCLYAYMHMLPICLCYVPICFHSVMQERRTYIPQVTYIHTYMHTYIHIYTYKHMTHTYI